MTGKPVATPWLANIERFRRGDAPVFLENLHAGGRKFRSRRTSGLRARDGRGRQVSRSLRLDFRSAKAKGYGDGEHGPGVAKHL